MNLLRSAMVIIIFLMLTALNIQNFASGKTGIVPEKILVSSPGKIMLPIVKDSHKPAKAILSLLQNDIIQCDLLDAVTGDMTNPIVKSWREMTLSADGKLSFSPLKGVTATEQYFSFFITASTFVPAKLKIECDAALAVYIGDTKKITAKDGIPDSVITYEQDLKLTTGVHRVIIRTILPESNRTGSLKISLFTDEPFTENIVISLRPEKMQTVFELLDDTKISSASLSNDGSYAAVTVNRYNHSAKKNDAAFFIYRTSDKKLVFSNPAASSLSQFSWSKKSPAKYWYAEPNGSEYHIRQADVLSGENIVVIPSLKDFSGFRVSEDESYIIIFKNNRKKEDSKNYKRYNSPNDRWPWSGSRNVMYLFDTQKGTMNQILDLEKNISLLDISPSGDKWLLSFSEGDFLERPFSVNYCMEYTLSRGTLDTVKSFRWFNTARYLDENRVIFSGGPSMFGSAGIQTDTNMIPNEYDTQLYLYDLLSKSVSSLTKDFNPAIENYSVDPDKKILHIVAEEGSYKHYYQYTIESRTFRKIPLSVDVINSLYTSATGRVLYTGSTAVTHTKVYLHEKGNSTVLFDPAPHITNSYKKSAVENMNYIKPDGRTIEGFLYYPVDYDKSKKYPCIVFYYGGTSPTSKEFEGRYPKNLWTANGYFVYIVQPSGATGYGQAFSALHVNDWGKTTSDEIINATTALVRKIPAIDSTKLGCIGASYGGFMTMTLLTKTDRFAAAVSHAGISLLPSYWGIGYWGYLYSALATAGSYPWNRKDIYVDLSPLFNADKVTTPLLLLHGNSDTNVPPGESMQFYTALKILGKEVELIEIDKQDHHILEHDKRKFWTELIISWFNKKLKNEPLYWNYLLENKD